MEQKIDDNKQLVISMQLATDKRLDFKILRYKNKLYYAIRNKDTSFPIYHIYHTHESTYYKNTLVFTFIGAFTKVNNAIYVSDYYYGGERKFAFDPKFENGLECLKLNMKDVHFDVKASLRKAFRLTKNSDIKLYINGLTGFKIPNIEPNSKFVIDFSIDKHSAAVYKIMNGKPLRVLYKDSDIQGGIIPAFSNSEYNERRKDLLMQLYPEFFGGDSCGQTAGSNGPGDN